MISGSGMINATVAFVPVVVFLGLLVSMGVGVFFGAYPAVKASRLDPVESLRWE